MSAGSEYGMLARRESGIGAFAKRQVRSTLLAVVGGGLLSSACLRAEVCSEEGTCFQAEEKVAPELKVGFAGLLPVLGNEKVDVLFVVDGSASMGDKQELLASAIPSLLRRLLEPLCVEGGQYNGATATGGICPSGSPEFPPVVDLHVGVISSNLSLGLACAENGGNPDDRAWLLPFARRELLGVEGLEKGFVEWRARDPASVAPDVVAERVQLLVGSVGEDGCGFEATLESWYRFLVDPSPASSAEITQQGVELSGVDDELLRQRAAFLRPDSLVLIIIVSDENDCSLAPSLEAVQLAQAPPDTDTGASKGRARSTAICQSDPSSVCCRPCYPEAPTPEDCESVADDPECAKGAYPAAQDPMNLRCFDSRRRFGIDALFPTSRYVRALTAPTVVDRFGSEQANPLLVSSSGYEREQHRVILAGLLGVPWQDLTANETGEEGVELRYFTAQEMDAEGRWALLLRDTDASSGRALDPHMIESVSPRSGRHPFVTGAELVPPDAPTTSWDAINGREHESPSELQYACIFPLAAPRLCDSTVEGYCDCFEEEGVAAKSPLCMNSIGEFSNLQHYGKAFPATRQLEVLRDIGKQAVVGSVCPRFVASEAPEADPNFGYNAIVGSIAESLKSSFANQCLPEANWLNPSGELECLVLEVAAGEECDCSSPGRMELTGDLVELAVARIRERSESDTAIELGSSLCGCAIAPATGDDRERCETVLDSDELKPGYCYVDPGNGVGSEALTRDCPLTEHRLLRVVGPDTPRRGTVLAVGCYVQR